MDNRISLNEFKYSYGVSSKEDQVRLIQSVHMYPERFSNEVREYVDYIFNKRHDLYTLSTSEIENILTDDNYSNQTYVQSRHTQLEGFKIYSCVGEELAQGIFDYQKSVKLVQIYYFELKKGVVLKDRAGSILRDLIWDKYGEDTIIRFV